MEIPKIEVRFENLQISANVQLGSRALPTLVNYCRDTVEVRNINPLTKLFCLILHFCVCDCVYWDKVFYIDFVKYIRYDL